MVTAHHTVAFLAIAVCVLAAGWGFATYRRGREARRALAHLLAPAQTILVAQGGLCLLLLSGHHRAGQRLHYAYGTLALASVLAPWLYAPLDPRRRLLWFAGATLVAAALAVRAYMTGT